MTTDDDRIRYLESGTTADLGADELADLASVRDLLASPELWSEPPDGLEDRVVAAIASEAGVPAAPPTAAFDPPAAPAPPEVIDLAEERRKRRWGPLLSVAAAAVIIVGAAAFLTTRGDDPETFALALTSTELAPGASGEAVFSRTDSGWRIEFDVDGLERLDGGNFYEAWMSDGDVLVPVGTFNEGNDVVLWAGVSPMDYPILSVTAEVADGDQSSSGRRVLFGEFAEMGDMGDDDTGDMGDMDDTADTGGDMDDMTGDG